jgi:hypothetical protein
MSGSGVVEMIPSLRAARRTARSPFAATMIGGSWSGNE